MNKAGSDNNWHYNKSLQPYANKLRKDMIKAEACLWKYALRSGSLSDWQFRRQRPILNYIADFMCKDLLLVIEVDGITHLLEDTIKKDQRKDEDLESVGFKVIRFSDDEVLKGIENVIRSIEYWCERRRKEFSLPPPSPRQRGKYSSK